MRAAEFLGAQPGEDGSWRFAIGRELHGAFGGAFGGVVAAAAIMTARSLAPGRTPTALDIRFLRSLPAGTATATATALHAGRTLTCVSVDVRQEDGRLAARATVSFVDGEAVAPFTTDTDTPTVTAYDYGRPWSSGIPAPIIATLQPRSVPWPDVGAAVALRVPWTDTAAVAEAVCLPADMCVGPPVALGVAGEGLAHPNPDLSLRFAACDPSPEVIGVGRLVRVHAGLATVSIEVWSKGGLVAVGVSTSTLLKPA